MFCACWELSINYLNYLILSALLMIEMVCDRDGVISVLSQVNVQQEKSIS